MTAFVGKTYFERGDGGSPEAFNRICATFSISGLGQTNELVEVTTFCSNGYREYIGGNADGETVTIEANYDPADSDLNTLMDDVTAKINHNYRVVIEEGSPQTVLSFAATPMSWVINPSVDDRNTVSFTYKISGDITRTP